MDDEFAEVAVEAVIVLRRMEGWELAPAVWDEVTVLVDAVGAAIVGRDAATLLGVVDGLEGLEPGRTVGVGRGPTTAVPVEVRERVGRLVHRLGEVAPQRGGFHPSGYCDEPVTMSPEVETRYGQAAHG